MANFVFNIAKGRLRTYAELAGTNDALILVPIETTGIEADATLKDYDDLAALLAGTSNEQTTAGRKTITAATVTVDDTNDWATPRPHCRGQPRARSAQTIRSSPMTSSTGRHPCLWT